MRLIDAERIGEFAARYTEFDGKPLTDRERDLVRNVCGKISSVMPTAYDIGRALRQAREHFCCAECAEEIRERGREETCRGCPGEEVVRMIKGGMEDGQDIANTF